MNGLIPTDAPGVEGVFHKLKRLLLNIRKTRLFQIADHVRRDTENSSNFIDLEFACFQELRLFGRNTDGRVLHPPLQNGHLDARWTLLICDSFSISSSLFFELLFSSYVPPTVPSPPIKVRVFPLTVNSYSEYRTDLLA